MTTIYEKINKITDKEKEAMDCLKKISNDYKSDQIIPGLDIMPTKKNTLMVLEGS